MGTWLYHYDVVDIPGWYGGINNSNVLCGSLQTR